MKIAKYRFFLDFNKEINWINDMAKEGWYLEKVSFAGLFRYTFSQGEPGKYIYQSEFIFGLSKDEREEYFGLLKDCGITIVHQYGGWIYMRRSATEGPIELYTDKESKIKYYNRIISIFTFLFLLNGYFAVTNLFLYNDLRWGLGLLNLLVALIVTVPIIKTMKDKKNLQNRY